MPGVAPLLNVARSGHYLKSFMFAFYIQGSKILFMTHHHGLHQLFFDGVLELPHTWRGTPDGGVLVSL